MEIKSPEYGTMGPVLPAIFKQEPETKREHNLQTLIPEVQAQIFTYLEPVSSVCAGITCKTLYAIHQKSYKIVRLTESEGHVQGLLGVPAVLHYFLRTWMEERQMTWGGKYGIYSFISFSRQIYEEINFQQLGDRYRQADREHATLSDELEEVEAGFKTASAASSKLIALKCAELKLFIHKAESNSRFLCRKVLEAGPRARKDAEEQHLLKYMEASRKG